MVIGIHGLIFQKVIEIRNQSVENDRLRELIFFHKIEVSQAIHTSVCGITVNKYSKHYYIQLNNFNNFNGNFVFSSKNSASVVGKALGGRKKEDFGIENTFSKNNFHNFNGNFVFSS